jgi:ribose transport system permease protein
MKKKASEHERDSKGAAMLSDSSVAQAPSRRISLRTFLRHPAMALVGAIVLLLALFTIWVPGGRFLTTANFLDLAQQISVNAIIAFGMTLVILIGGIDLSVGAVVALVGVVTVTFLSHGLVAGLAAGLLTAAVAGLGNGLLAARTRMPPFIITLGMMLIVRGAAFRFNEGRPLPAPASALSFFALGTDRLGGWLPTPVIFMAVVFAGTAVLLHRTRFGQHLYAIGGNREAARFTGIALGRNEATVYLLSACCAGIAGIIQASQLFSGEPSAGQGFELNAIAAVVVGGTSFTGGIGSIPGTLLGAIIIGILDKGLNQAGVHFSLQSIVKGIVILGAVYVDARRSRK